LKAKFSQNTKEVLFSLASNPTVRRAVGLGAFAAVAAVDMFASTGTLKLTQGLASLSTEVQGPLAYSIGGIALGFAGFEYVKHQELSRVGWGATAAAGGIGLMASGPTIMTLFGMSGAIV
jgi:hypothetical protein